MIKKKEVSLHSYTSEVTIKYDLPSSQLEFTGLPQDIIKRDAKNPDKHLVIIKVRDQVAGFLNWMNPMTEEGIQTIPKLCCYGGTPLTLSFKAEALRQDLFTLYLILSDGNFHLLMKWFSVLMPGTSRLKLCSEKRALKIRERE